ncbi:hypothetical protein QE152_g38727 [Popillia japonica]|uniref:Retrotransposon gag domain-containing protein n=1 Tax=Popillia japonica TaxID=7064 RepID=A0AAW1HVZ8_POPJA
MLLAAISKLSGYAEQWFHSKPSHAALPLGDLKEAMCNIFNVKEDIVTRTRRFENHRTRSPLYFTRVNEEPL